MGITEYSLGLQRGMWDVSLEAVGPEPAKISNDEFILRQQRLFSQLRPNDLLIITAPSESTRSNDVLSISDQQRHALSLWLGRP